MRSTLFFCFYLVPSPSKYIVYYNPSSRQYSRHNNTLELFLNILYTYIHIVEEDGNGVKMGWTEYNMNGMKRASHQIDLWIGCCYCRFSAFCENWSDLKRNTFMPQKIFLFQIRKGIVNQSIISKVQLFAYKDEKMCETFLKSSSLLLSSFTHKGT